MAESLAAFLLGPYTDAHQGSLDFESLFLYTKKLGLAEYIKKQFDDNNINATTVLKTSRNKLQPYIGKTLFEIYIIAACNSVRYIFDDDGDDFIKTLHIFMDYKGKEIADNIAMKVLSAVNNPEYNYFDDDIVDYKVRGTMLDILALESSDFIKNYTDWSKVRCKYWENIKCNHDNVQPEHLLMYMKYCSNYLRTFKCIDRETGVELDSYLIYENNID
jgi:hypothetical protein